MRVLLFVLVLFLSHWASAQRDMRLLIVASQTQEEALEAWTTWRQQTGVVVEMLWLEEVHAFPDAEDIQAAIRSKHTTFDFTHVLLIGDAWTLPYHLSDAGVMHDHGYGLLDDSDYALDVAVGRLPFNDPPALANYLDQLIAYEKGNSTGAGPEVLISASTLHHDDDHGRYLHSWTESNGYTTTTLLQSENTNQRDEFLHTLTNEGGWVTYFGHGTNIGWNSLTPGFSTSDIENLEYTVPPVIFSAACASSDPRLANNGSLGGQFMEQGALAFLGATEDCYYDYSDTLIKTAHKTALGDPEADLGHILMESKASLLQSFPNNTWNLTHLTLEHFVLFADPTLIPFRKSPIQSGLEVNRIQGNQWEVTTQAGNVPVTGMTLTITDDAGHWMAIGESDASGQFRFELPEETNSFTATAFKAGYSAHQKDVEVEQTHSLQLVRQAPGQWQVQGLEAGETSSICFYATTGQLLGCDLTETNGQVALLTDVAGIYLYHLRTSSGQDVRGKVSYP